MLRLKLLLAAAAVVLAGSLSASALPVDARLAGITADQSSIVTQARSRRSSRCFRRCLAGGRLSCRRADSVEGCCRAACSHPRR